MKELLKKIKDIPVVFKRVDIEKIIQQFESEFESKLANVVTAIDNDYGNYSMKTKVEQLRNIIKEIKEEPIEISDNIEGNSIKEGYGTIVALYNGKPEITLKLMLYAVKTHNKIVLCSENEFDTNIVLIEIMKSILKDNGFNPEIVNISDERQDIVNCQDYIDKVIFIGDKYGFVNLRKKLYVDIEYNGYGFLSVYYDNESDLNNVEQMKIYAFNNMIEIDTYNDEISEAIDKINYLPFNETVIFFSKEKSKIIKGILNIKADKIYVNENPLANYEFDISQNSFVRTKKLKFMR